MSSTSHNTDGHRSDAVAFLYAELGHRFRSVWVTDFEFEAKHDVLPTRVVVMVARDVISGREIRLGPGQFGECPFLCDGTELFIAFQAGAEAHCFIQLGWKLPPCWIDLWAEAVRLTNGQVMQTTAGPKPVPNSLLAVMARYGLRVRDSGHKKSMQILVGGGTWRPEDVPAIVAYCAEDVEDTVHLLHRMLPGILNEAPVRATALSQAIIRGSFGAANAQVEIQGLPVDVASFNLFLSRWNDIRGRLIAEVDAAYGVFDGQTFSQKRFAAYLSREAIAWPRLASGELDLDKDTFRHRAKGDARVAPLRELREALSQVRGHSVTIDADGRSRVRLRPFASKTARSQPSNSKYLFGTARWVRSFIKAPPGFTFAYLDFKSEEIAVAAYLAGDERLVESYTSGDPYIAFAKAAGLVPQDASKKSHPRERGACKAIVLGVQYGMGAEGMSASSGVPLDTCRELLLRHREAYRPFWKFVQRYRDRLAGGAPAYTPLGWRLQLGAGSELNERSNGNWPVQSTGSDILRVAVLFCQQAGVVPCATIHDALAFVVPTAQADELLTITKDAMERAAAAVVGGHIGVDVTRYDSPDVYKDEPGFDFYERVMRLANE
jgi:DNA polymerase-1